MPTDIFRRWLLLLLTVALCSDAATACEILVRDAAFRTPRDLYRLCVIANSSDPAAEEIAARLTGWLDEDAADLNVDLIRVAADDPNVRWSDYGIPSAPPSMPVTVLVGTNREIGLNFYIQHWEPEPTPEELLALAESPLRQRLQQELGQHLAVVLYVRCDNCEDDRVPALLEMVGREWQDVQGSGLGVSVIEVDRHDPQERLVLSLAGVTPDGPDWVGVVFGRGKLMNPPLTGEEITPGALSELLEQVVADCSCSKPLPSMGVDLPMVWTTALDEQFVALGVPAEDGESDGVTLAGLGTTPATPPVASPPPDDVRLPVSTSSSAFNWSTYRWVLRSLTLAVVVVAASSWWLLRRSPG